jgi:hypothetical protein
VVGNNRGGANLLDYEKVQAGVPFPDNMVFKFPTGSYIQEAVMNSDNTQLYVVNVWAGLYYCDMKNLGTKPVLTLMDVPVKFMDETVMNNVISVIISKDD